MGSPIPESSGKSSGVAVKQCRNCGEAISESRVRRGAVYCSANCSLEWQRGLYAAKAYRLGLPSGTVGAMHELLAAYDLMKRGYHVFRALSPSCSCDLAIIDGDRLVRVEVRTASSNRLGRLSFARPKKEAGNQDCYAAVEHCGTVHYVGSGDSPWVPEGYAASVEVSNRVAP